jgi:hypothetical protein
MTLAEASEAGLVRPEALVAFTVKVYGLSFKALEMMHDVVDEDGHLSPAGFEVTA